MDEEQGTLQFSYWYDIKESELHANVREKFIRHFYDSETEEFVTNACNISYLKHAYDNTMTIFLVPFMSATSRNGFLNRGLMFVASGELFHKVLRGCGTGRLLDIGAGSGLVTTKFAGIFREVFATETSASMKSRLQSKGYTVLDINSWKEETFDVISCLNVLDRCHEPMELLQDMRSSLGKTGGMVMVALVLPYKGTVEEGNTWVSQQDPMPIRGISVEEQLSCFITKVLEPMGFELNFVTKVPYLCTGDLYAKYYSLTDCLMTLTVKKDSD